MPTTFSFDLNSRDLFPEERPLIDLVKQAVLAGGGVVEQAEPESSAKTARNKVAAKAKAAPKTPSMQANPSSAQATRTAEPATAEPGGVTAARPGAERQY
ncbi:MAG TPA: hypothetical protein VF800_29900 [Telluria sp.]|jgi:hypothetical protein